MKINKITDRSQFLDDLPSAQIGKFPATRYQGSKYKVLQWIKQHTTDLEFDTVLDAFGGTGAVGYMFKQQGKQVTYNDSLKFNYYVGLALIENSNTWLDDSDIDFVLKRHQNIRYPSFIFDTFHDIYFTDEENKWLDCCITNIRQLEDARKQALAYFALFQSCLAKRPYNLFHRKNLYVRTADVPRSFGNKKTWDTPFETHFVKFAHQANQAVFDNGRKNRAYSSDIFDLKVPAPDLVYIDTPYISKHGVGVNYFDFYHFLDGMVMYDEWANLIDQDSKHKKIKNGKSEWCKKGEIHDAFRRLFDKFSASKLVVSYRDDGTPTIEELTTLLKQYKGTVTTHTYDYKYALSKSSSKEVLIIAE